MVSPHRWKINNSVSLHGDELGELFQQAICLFAPGSKPLGVLLVAQGVPCRLECVECLLTEDIVAQWRGCHRPEAAAPARVAPHQLGGDCADIISIQVVGVVRCELEELDQFVLADLCLPLGQLDPDPLRDINLPTHPTLLSFPLAKSGFLPPIGGFNRQRKFA